MLTSFTVANYRSFVAPTRIELRPLTLLFGYNNAGKSALLRVLPLIAESVLDGNRGPLKLAVASRGGSFADLESRLNPGRGLTLELAWSEDSAFAVELRYLQDLRRLIVSQIRASRGKTSVEGRWIPEREPGGLGNRYEIEMTGSEGSQSVPLRFSGLTPGLVSESSSLPDLATFLSTLQRDVHRIASGVQWLGSLRQPPERSWKPQGAPPARLGFNGEGYADVLLYDKIDHGGVLEEVSGWFEKYFDQILDVYESGDNAYITLSPADAAGLRVPLTDKGEGMAQALPVLVALAMASRKAAELPWLLALEQPELHLHPAAEVALAQRLTETAAREHPPTILVETHSENLLLSVQLQVLEGRIPTTDVLVYWVEQLSDGSSVVRPLHLNRDGEIPDWPPGVFSEDVDLARKLFVKRRKKKVS